MRLLQRMRSDLGQGTGQNQAWDLVYYQNIAMVSVGFSNSAMHSIESNQADSTSCVSVNDVHIALRFLIRGHIRFHKM